MAERVWLRETKAKVGLDDLGCEKQTAAVIHTLYIAVIYTVLYQYAWECPSSQSMHSTKYVFGSANYFKLGHV